MTKVMTKEEIINLANRCSRKIWEICMEEPGFSTNDCPEGADGLSDIVLNVILKAFPATKECSSIPSDLDEAADIAKQEYVYNEGGPFPNTTGVSFFNGFKAGAEWMAGQGCTVEIDEGYFINNQHNDRRKGKFHKYYSSVFGHSKKITVTPGDNLVVQIRKKQPSESLKETNSEN